MGGGKKQFAPKAWTRCCKAGCDGWEYDATLADRPWCSKCWSKLQSGQTQYHGGKWKEWKDSDKGKGKGQDELANALKTLTNSMGSLNVDPSVNQHLQVVATQLTAAAQAQIKPAKSKAVRLAEAARALEDATRGFQAAHRQVTQAEEKLATARANLEAKGKLVVEQESLIESIHNEGKPAAQLPTQPPQRSQESFMEKLLAADVKDLQKAGIIDLDMEEEYDAADLDDEAKAQLERAKELMAKELQQGARSYKEQMAKHLEAAKAKQHEEMLLITRAAKKRKSEQEVAAPAAQVPEAPQAETPPGAGGEAPKAAPAPAATGTATSAEEVLERLRAQQAATATASGSAASASGAAASASGGASQPPTA